MNPALRAAVLLRWGAQCAACGEAAARLEIDHVKPRERGGSDDLDNLRPLCPRCHKRKTSRETSWRAKAARVAADWTAHNLARLTKTRRPNAKKRAQLRAKENFEKRYTTISKRMGD